MRTIEWRGDHAVLIDQTRLPHEIEWLEVARRRHDDRRHPPAGRARRAGDRRRRRVRRRPGRPAGRARGARRRASSAREAERIAAARPTAVNLSWAVRRVVAQADDGAAAVVAAAVELARRTCARTGRSPSGARRCWRSCAGESLRVHTHCNTGGLACVEWGTALGIVRALHERGHLASVTADETRPLLQGARLTAFELVQMGIEHHIVVDGAGPSVIARGLADAVIVGADRIAANGDVANKIGTYPAGARRGAGRHPVRRGGAGVDARPGDGDGRRHRDRGARSPTRCSASASGASPRRARGR